MILLVRSADAEFDSRLNKYIKALELASIDFHVLCWPRNRTPDVKSGYTFFGRKAKYGGKFKSLFAYFSWFFFLVHFIVRNHKSISIIHAVDLDTGLPIYCLSKVFNIPVIYDVYDHFADSRGLKGWLYKLVSWMERYILNTVEVGILASDARIIQHGLSDSSNIIIIENVPHAKIGLKTRLNDHFQPLKLAYVGVLENEHRGLENLLDLVAENDSLELHIAGFGPLEDKIRENNSSNIIFYGSVSQSKAQSILIEAHVSVGMYYLSSTNHKFAAPNKYYEHLMVGRPLITSRGTPPGYKVERYDTGWVIGDSKKDLEIVLSEIINDPGLIVEKANNAHESWNNYYSTYFNNKLRGEYVELVRKYVLISNDNLHLD